MYIDIYPSDRMGFKETDGKQTKERDGLLYLNDTQSVYGFDNSG